MPGSQHFTPDPRNATALVYLNGALLPREEAKVSILDAGFIAGDGIWEGLRLHKDCLLFLEAHLDRLYWGAERIGLDIGLDRKALAKEIRRLLRANDMHDGVHLRIMVTRGEKVTPNQDPRNALGLPTIAIIAEYKSPDPSVINTGLTVATSSIRCTPKNMFDMRLNSHSRLNLILALQDAVKAGADEALMLDPQGNVSTCNATNFFCVVDGTVLTSSGDYCFNGITRGQIIELCQENGIPITIGDFTLDEVKKASEAFVTGTFGGAIPVAEIDTKPLPLRLPGPVTRRVRELYEALKDAETEITP